MKNVRARLRGLRDLPLAWKMAAPPLVMVLVFTVPAFAIVRDLTSRASAQLSETLARRGEETRSSIQQDEFYLLDAVRLASNLQGLSDAVLKRDAQGVIRAFGSVAALKDRLDVLVATDAKGVALAQIIGPKGHRDVRAGAAIADPKIWARVGPVMQAASGGARPRAGLIVWKQSTLLAVAAPIRGTKGAAGVVLAGIDLRTVVGNAVPKDVSAAVFDLEGTPAATGGDLALTDPLATMPRAGMTRTATIHGQDATSLFVPLVAGGARVGTIAVTLARAPAFALAARVTRNLEILLIVAIACGVLLLFFLTRFLLAQITILFRTNTELGRGDLDSRARVLSRDELGRVAEGLNAMAAELQTSYAELENRVAQRTNELQIARDEADEAARAKAQFLANMSHEIRTPMNAVIGMTSLLFHSKLDNRQRDYVDTIRTSGDHLLTVINDILDFSKIEAGKLELEMHPFTVSACVEEAMDLVALRATEQRTELAYVIDDAMPLAFLGDLGRTRQVLLNLLSNAVKFTARGEVVVTVTASKLDSGKHEIHFTVRDTGIGIPEERMELLFAPFSQLDASTTRTYGGTGLGLAICRLLVELMGGRVWADSEPGRGSTFHFTIVAEETEAPNEASFAAADFAGMRVLVVDDNKTNRQIAAAYVRRWGMIPTDVATPARALKVVAESKPFDIAILDHHMPGMNGTELGIRLRRRHPSTPMILLSSMGEGPRNAADLFSVILTKPIKPSQLHDAIAQALAGARATPVRSIRGLDPRTASRRPLRILVAEDNQVNQKVAGAVLGKLGYKPDFASNGAEALDAVVRQEYDVVLMDVQMPEMDGLQASRAICERRPEGPRPRIVAMTANATAQDRRDCLAAGMDDYLAKPVTPAKMVEALSRCLRVDYSRAGRRRPEARSKV